MIRFKAIIALFTILAVFTASMPLAMAGLPCLHAPEKAAVSIENAMPPCHDAASQKDPAQQNTCKCFVTGCHASLMALPDTLTLAIPSHKPAVYVLEPRAFEAVNLIPEVPPPRTV